MEAGTHLFLSVFQRPKRSPARSGFRRLRQNHGNDLDGRVFRVADTEHHMRNTRRVKGIAVKELSVPPMDLAGGHGICNIINNQNIAFQREQVRYSTVQYDSGSRSQGFKAHSDTLNYNNAWECTKIWVVLATAIEIRVQITARTSARFDVRLHLLLLPRRSTKHPVIHQSEYLVMPYLIGFTAPVRPYRVCYIRVLNL